MKFPVKYFWFLALLLGADFSFGQGGVINSRQRVQSLFLYNFAEKYIEWPEKMKKGSFVIGVLGDSPILIELPTVIGSKKIGDQSIEIKKFNSVDEITKCHIIFIPFEKSDYIKGAVVQLENSSTLIISEKDGALNFGSDINFVSITGKLRFEINLGITQSKGITVGPDLLKLSVNTINDVSKPVDIKVTTLSASGKSFEINPVSTLTTHDVPLPESSEKDWAKLYKEMERLLEGEKQVVEWHKKELGETREQVDELRQQNLEQQNILNEKTKILTEKEIEIENQITTLNQQKDEINSREILIDIKKEELFKKQKQIAEQDKILNNQVEAINKQKFIISSAVVMFIIVLGFVFFVVRSNFQRQKAYRIISAQKEQAEKARQIIEEKKEELEQSYAILTQQQEELQKTFTELKNTQSQLVQSEKMASLGQLTAGVAHEINNPINFVSAGIDSVRQNYSDIKNLLDKYFALPVEGASAEQLKSIETFKKEIDFDSVMEEMEHLLKSIKNGAMRTTEIVKSLRNFSRLDEYALKKANIHEGIDSTLTILTNKIKNRIEIVKEYDSLPEITCFPGQLNQAFMNILNNAIDAIPVNGTIHIRTKAIRNHVEIRIKDTGKGMTDEVKRKIFEPFFTTKNVGEGTGLGLSITFGIIEKHKGSIQVESEPGKGTEFIIQIPMNLG